MAGAAGGQGRDPGSEWLERGGRDGEGNRRYVESAPGTRTPATFMFSVLRGPMKVEPEKFANDLNIGI